MISYEPFYQTLKEKGFSTYRLIHEFGVSRSLLDRLKHNRPISTVTLNDLCKILDCRVEDIILFMEDNEAVALYKVNDDKNKLKSYIMFKGGNL